MDKFRSWVSKPIPATSVQTSTWHSLESFSLLLRINLFWLALTLLWKPSSLSPSHLWCCLLSTFQPSGNVAKLLATSPSRIWARKLKMVKPLNLKISWYLVLPTTSVMYLEQQNTWAFLNWESINTGNRKLKCSLKLLKKNTEVRNQL